MKFYFAEKSQKQILEYVYFDFDVRNDALVPANEVWLSTH